MHDATNTYTVKRCSLCNEEKETDDFNRKSSARDGYQSYCRECSHTRWAELYPRALRAEQQRKQKEEIKNYIKLYIAHRLCDQCSINRATILIPKRNLSEALSRKYSLERIKTLVKHMTPLCNECFHDN